MPDEPLSRQCNGGLAQAGRSPHRSKPAPTSASHARLAPSLEQRPSAVPGSAVAQTLREAIVPRLSADAVLRAAGTTSAGSCASRRQVHHLDDPAARRTAPARDASVFSLNACCGLSSAHPSEDAVDVGHGDPRHGSGLRLGRPMTAEDGARRKLSGTTAPAVRRLNSAAGFRRKRFAIKGLSLRGKSANPQGPETRRLSGEENRPSFRPRTLKVRTEEPAEPAPFSAGHRHGECCAKSRLERAKGFEPSTPTLASLGLPFAGVRCRPRSSTNSAA